MQGIFLSARFLFHNHSSTWPGLKVWKLWLSPSHNVYHQLMWVILKRGMAHTVYRIKGYLSEECAEGVTTKRFKQYISVTKDTVFPFIVPLTGRPDLTKKFKISPNVQTVLKPASQICVTGKLYINQSVNMSILSEDLTFHYSSVVPQVVLSDITRPKLPQQPHCPPLTLI